MIIGFQIQSCIERGISLLPYIIPDGIIINIQESIGRTKGIQGAQRTGVNVTVEECDVNSCAVKIYISFIWGSLDS